MLCSNSLHVAVKFPFILGKLNYKDIFFVLVLMLSYRDLVCMLVLIYFLLWKISLDAHVEFWVLFDYFSLLLLLLILQC